MSISERAYQQACGYAKDRLQSRELGSPTRIRQRSSATRTFAAC